MGAALSPLKTLQLSSSRLAGRRILEHNVPGTSCVPSRGTRAGQAARSTPAPGAWSTKRASLRWPARLGAPVRSAPVAASVAVAVRASERGAGSTKPGTLRGPRTPAWCRRARWQLVRRLASALVVLQLVGQVLLHPVSRRFFFAPRSPSRRVAVSPVGLRPRASNASALDPPAASPSVLASSGPGRSAARWRLACARCRCERSNNPSRRRKAPRSPVGVASYCGRTWSLY